MDQTTITLSLAAAAQIAVGLVAYGQLKGQVSALRDEVRELKHELRELAPRRLKSS